MDLDKIAVRLRPRTPYEAIDLGFVLVRNFWRPLLLGWVAGALPFFIGAALVSALTPLFWLPLIALWWLKPLFDRIALFVLSRGFFGDLPPTARTLDYALRGWRSWGTVADITWRRLSPWRSVAMPVRELEQLSGDAAGARLKLLLRREIRGPAALLTFVGFGVEWVLLGASIFLLAMVIPEATGINMDDQFLGLFDGPGAAPAYKVYVFAMYFICMGAVETVYVAAGLGLYINRRVGLEGWDIELTFRRLARRLRKRGAAIARAGSVLLIGLSLGFALAPKPVFAQADEGVEVSVSDMIAQFEDQVDASKPIDPQVEIARILEDPVFGEDKIEKQWQLREDLFEKDKTESGGIFQGLMGTIAIWAEIIVWGLVGIFVLVAIYLLLKYLKPHRISMPRTHPDTIEPAQFEAVKQVVQIALPDDIVAAAMAAWQRGEKTESLSLLYRGTIRGLAQGYRIEVDPSMTTRESVQMVREAGGPVDYIREMAAAWTQVVYAGRELDDAEARALFVAWKQHFSASERASSDSNDRRKL